MSQNFSVPKIEIAPQKFDFVSTPAFQKQMANLRTASANAMAAIETGKKAAAAITERVNTKPSFELDPQTKEQLAACRNIASSVGATAKNSMAAAKAELERISQSRTTTPAQQEKLERISTGFARIEEIGRTLQLPKMKENA